LRRDDEQATVGEGLKIFAYGKLACAKENNRKSLKGATLIISAWREINKEIRVYPSYPW